MKNSGPFEERESSLGYFQQNSDVTKVRVQNLNEGVSRLVIVGKSIDVWELLTSNDDERVMAMYSGICDFRDPGGLEGV